MVSQEFKSAVANGDLLLTRIMLKDSFVVDPTFVRFSEMFAYAKQTMPDLLVPFDNEQLEEDSSKWNQEVMNMELVQLVNNFSEIRIVHLQKVVFKVMASKIAKAKAQTKQQSSVSQCHQQKPATGYKSNSPFAYSNTDVLTPDECKRQALQQMMTEGKRISGIIQTVEDTKGWKSQQICELEKSARKLLRAIKEYKDNR